MCSWVASGVIVKQHISWLSANQVIPASDIILFEQLKINPNCHFRPVRARKAAVLCIKRALQICCIKGTPRVALVSDTPAFVKEMKSEISEFAEVSFLLNTFGRLHHLSTSNEFG